MAMITPADSIPTMIPPADYPLEGQPGEFQTRPISRHKNNSITIEVRELYVLSDFLAAFSDYINNRNNPEASAKVMRRYRAALSFYDGQWQGDKPKQYRKPLQ